MAEELWKSEAGWRGKMEEERKRNSNKKSGTGRTRSLFYYFDYDFLMQRYRGEGPIRFVA